MKFDHSKNQLRWVILLLAVAVILPTVCLLWFMTQAVKNERLAVRQKLVDICQNEVDDFTNHFNEAWTMAISDHHKRLSGLVNQEKIWLWLNAIKGDADGAAIYDANMQLLYPVMGDYPGAAFTAEVQQAFELEQRGDYAKALEQYQSLVDANDPAIFAASMGTLRCLEALGKTVEAADFFHTLLWSDNQQIRKQFTPSEVAMVRIKHLQWLDEHKDTYTSGATFLDLDLWYTQTENYPSEVSIWALEKMLAIAQKYRESWKLDDIIEKARQTIHTEQTSLAGAGFFADAESVRNWPEQQWKSFEAGQTYYAMKYLVGEKSVLLIKTEDALKSDLETEFENLQIDGITARLIDDQDRVIFDSQADGGDPFLTMAFSDHLPGWRLQLLFENGNVFENAAKRQAAIYTWTGILVIVLILASGAVATQTISRQIRLNRLKNDFIATVTHELKTPLASMRVLVDTLLEDRYADSEQANEYLELIAKENTRLSHLIDNFLTFSRMERNKQAFEMRPCRPSEIAEAAAEAVQTKFNQNNQKKCDFSVNIAEDLASISVDSDALVTVLVNLLDNAYKYSHDDKRIELSVFTEDSYVCFSVKDNGIGMTRRQMKRIFERFYQADSSLSRRAEGTGLGLSIVKFILDAHKAKIEVDSKPGKGSEFIVKIPGERHER